MVALRRPQFSTSKSMKTPLLSPTACPTCRESNTIHDPIQLPATVDKCLDGTFTTSAHSFDTEWCTVGNIFTSSFNSINLFPRRLKKHTYADFQMHSPRRSAANAASQHRNIKAISGSLAQLSTANEGNGGSTTVDAAGAASGAAIKLFNAVRHDERGGGVTTRSYGLATACVGNAIY